jgi:hypothetical protein
MQFLYESERNQIRELLRQHGVADPDHRGEECDCHLVFEALHVLADGIPERLYAMIHPAGPKRHQHASEGFTMLWFLKIANQGAMACDGG